MPYPMAEDEDRFTVKDSGERAEFDGGAVRDTEKGKPRYDLISPYALRRLAHHLRRGAEKYGDRNWEKGMPRSRLFSSALRHLYQAIMNEQDEDHLSAVLFNVMAIIHFEEKPTKPTLERNKPGIKQEIQLDLKRVA